MARGSGFHHHSAGLPYLFPVHRAQLCSRWCLFLLLPAADISRAYSCRFCADHWHTFGDPGCTPAIVEFVFSVRCQRGVGASFDIRSASLADSSLWASCGGFRPSLQREWARVSPVLERFPLDCHGLWRRTWCGFSGNDKASLKRIDQDVLVGVQVILSLHWMTEMLLQYHLQRSLAQRGVLTAQFRRICRPWVFS